MGKQLDDDEYDLTMKLYICLYMSMYILFRFSYVVLDL
jgi:hypothetical protein